MAFPRNDEAYNRMLSEFQQTNDSSFAHESLASSYLALPGLRGFWPMSALGADGEALDLGGLNGHLTNVNTALTLALPQPAVHFQTANSEALYIDTSQITTFDILGTEAYVDAAYRGLTLGAWIYFDAIGQTHGFMGKWSTIAGNFSYLLHVTAANEPEMHVSTDGTATIGVTHTTAVVANQWNFIVGRFDPSTEVKVWLNDVAVVETTSVPASLFNGNASFTVGAYGTGPGTFAAYMEGKVSMAFLCAAYLPDHTVRRLYYRTRPAYQNREQW